jgi:iron(III) transport system permease protein
MSRAIILWILVGVTGAAVLPWYALNDGLFSTGWMRAYPNAESGSALYQIAVLNRFWLLAPLAPLAAAFIVTVMRLVTAQTARLLMWLSIAGMVLMLLHQPV